MTVYEEIVKRYCKQADVLSQRLAVALQDVKDAAEAEIREGGMVEDVTARASARMVEIDQQFRAKLNALQKQEFEESSMLDYTRAMTYRPN